MDNFKKFIEGKIEDEDNGDQEEENLKLDKILSGAESEISHLIKKYIDKSKSVMGEEGFYFRGAGFKAKLKRSLKDIISKL